MEGSKVSEYALAVHHINVPLRRRGFHVRAAALIAGYVTVKKALCKLVKRLCAKSSADRHLETYRCQPSDTRRSPHACFSEIALGPHAGRKKARSLYAFSGVAINLNSFDREIDGGNFTSM